MSDLVKRILSPFLVVLFVVALAPGEACGPSTQLIQYDKGRKLCNLANAAINESSGLACSRLKPGVFWTHNDSGDSARIFAFNAQGDDLATCTLTGAQAVDWEDMASFQLDDQNLLLIADVGDNALQRDTCTLYVVDEPDVDDTQRNVAQAVKPALTIRFRYEDGPHNCEAVAVDPTTKTIYLFTKAWRRTCTVYALPWPNEPADEPLVASAVATLKLPPVTAADISPDGLRAVLLTYGQAYEYTRQPDEAWANAFARATSDPRSVSCSGRVHWLRAGR